MNDVRIWEAIEGLMDALRNMGPVPEYHARIESKHRREWSTLWNRIDALKREHDRECNVDHYSIG